MAGRRSPWPPCGAQRLAAERPALGAIRGSVYGALCVREQRAPPRAAQRSARAAAGRCLQVRCLDAECVSARRP
jgi:hypothetical protein